MTHLRSYLAVGAVALALTTLVLAGETKSPSTRAKCCCEAGCPAAAAKCTGSCTKCCKTQTTGATEASEPSTKATGCCDQCKKSGQKDCCCKSCSNKECCGTCCKDCPACAAACNSKAEIRVYSVADLLAGSKECRPNDVVRVITGVVQTASWECNGGSGAIEYFPGTHSLVIRQTPAIHQQVADLLTSLRKAGNANKPQTVSFHVAVPGCQIMAAAAPVCVTATCSANTSCPVPAVTTACQPCPSCCGYNVTSPLNTEMFLRTVKAAQTPAGMTGNVFFANGFMPTSACPPAVVAANTPACCASCRNVMVFRPEQTGTWNRASVMAVDPVCTQKPEGCETHLMVSSAGGNQLQCDKFCVWVSGCKPIEIALCGAPAQQGIVQAVARSAVPGTVQIRCGNFTATAGHLVQVDGQRFQLSGKVHISCCDAGCPPTMDADQAVVSVTNGCLHVDRVERDSNTIVPTSYEESTCPDPLAYLIWSSLFGSW